MANALSDAYYWIFIYSGILNFCTWKKYFFFLNKLFLDYYCPSPFFNYTEFVDTHTMSQLVYWWNISLLPLVTWIFRKQFFLHVCKSITKNNELPRKSKILNSVLLISSYYDLSHRENCEVSCYWGVFKNLSFYKHKWHLHL